MCFIALPDYSDISVSESDSQKVETEPPPTTDLQHTCQFAEGTCWFYFDNTIVNIITFIFYFTQESTPSATTSSTSTASNTSLSDSISNSSIITPAQH